MRKIRIVILAVMAFVALGSSAQDNGVPVRTAEEEAAKQTAMLLRNISLDSSQLDTVYAVHLRYAKLRRRPEYANNRRQLFEQMISELKGILTEGQYAELRKMQAERKRMMQKPMVILTDSVAQAPAVMTTDTMPQLQSPGR